MINFLTQNMSDELLTFSMRIFPFFTASLMICFCIGLLREYVKEKVQMKFAYLWFGLSTIVAIVHYEFCKFNWGYSLVIDKTAASFIWNILWILGGTIFYSAIFIIFIGLCIFAVVEKRRKNINSPDSSLLG